MRHGHGEDRVRHNQPWTDAEVSQLRTMAEEGKHPVDIAVLMDRSMQAIMQRAYQVGIVLKWPPSKAGWKRNRH